MEIPIMDCSFSELQLNALQSKNLADLPEEILLLILSHLPTSSLGLTAQVSKQFQRVCIDPSLWKIVRFKKEELKQATLRLVLSRGTKHLELDNCKVLEPFFLDDKPNKCDLNNITFTHNGHLPRPLYHCLLWILSFSPQLTSLVLTAELVTFGDEFFMELGDKYYLEVLHMWSDLKYPGILRIARGCQRLRSWIYFGREIEMTEDELHLLIKDLPASLEVIYIFKFNFSMRNKHVEELVERCPNITHLHLQSCSQLTSEAIGHLCKLKKLEYLNISRCCEITPHSLGQLSEVKTLKHLLAFEVIPARNELLSLQGLLPNVEIDSFALPMGDDAYD